MKFFVRSFTFFGWTVFFLPTLFFELTAAAPETIPEELFDVYTLNGQVPVIPWYFNDTDPTPTVYKYEQIENNRRYAKTGGTFYYGKTDTWLYAALDKYSHQIKGKDVAIMGSTTPVYEGIVLAWEGSPITIEYNSIISEHPLVKALTVDEYEKKPFLFDAILSISSYEHDGLGRYGDPLNPIGDLLAMAKTKKMLKKGGLLFLAVPIAQDCLIWNAHRTYGRLRFPLLIEGWEIIDTFGFSMEDFSLSYHVIHQPVFVLRPAE